MIIREAVPEDLDFFRRSLEENRRIERRPEKDIPVTDEDERSFVKGIEEKTVRVAEIEGSSVGFLYYRTDWDVMYINEEIFWIDLVFVEKDYRGRGIGRALYEDAIRIARELGYRKITIDVFDANGNSRNFHESIGFEPIYTIYQRELE